MQARTLLLAITLPLAAQDSAPASAVDHLLDRIVTQEQKFLDALSAHSPLVETYIQESSEGTPSKDHYFLGRARIIDTVDYEPLIEKTIAEPPSKGRSKTKVQPL